MAQSLEICAVYAFACHHSSRWSIYTKQIGDGVPHRQCTTDTNTQHRYQTKTAATIIEVGGGLTGNLRCDVWRFRTWTERNAWLRPFIRSKNLNGECVFMQDSIETSAAFRIRENDANCRPRADPLRPKVMVADDQRMLVDLLQDVLSPEFDLLAAATDGEELLAEMERQQPDIVVLGMNMPTIGGLDCGRFIRHSWPHVALVYL